MTYTVKDVARMLGVSDRTIPATAGPGVALCNAYGGGSTHVVLKYATDSAFLLKLVAQSADNG
jgi:hypothetical protein